jgi:pre-mRNA-splicing factor CWC22
MLEEGAIERFLNESRRKGTSSIRDIPDNQVAESPQEPQTKKYKIEEPIQTPAKSQPIQQLSKSRSRSRTPPRSRSRSYSRSRSRSYSRSLSRTPPRSRSRTPPRNRSKGYSRSLPKDRIRSSRGHFEQRRSRSKEKRVPYKYEPSRRSTIDDVLPTRIQEGRREDGEILENVEPYRSRDVLAVKESSEMTNSIPKIELQTKTGGMYMPPAKLAALQRQISDKSSLEYQKLSWEALKKSINGLINKVNTSNIKYIVLELFAENLIRGKGLFVRSLLKAQAASPTFTPVYAALVAVVNSKMPEIGLLVLKRLVLQFRKAYRRNEKNACLSSTRLIAHLVNQKVAHEILALQILRLLLKKSTDDSVEIAVGFIKECGAALQEIASKATNAVFESFRTILHEATIDKRVQYMIEVLFQVRKDKFKEYPSIPEDLDLIEEEDQVTHLCPLDGEFEAEEVLDVFRADPEFLDNEAKYREIKKEILGEEEGVSGNEEGREGSEAELSDSGIEAEDQTTNQDGSITMANRMNINDQTNLSMISLRKTIYLTIMSSLDFEECTHKLLKLGLPEDQEKELSHMIVDACSQERTYRRFYGSMGHRLCNLHRKWQDYFEQCFNEYYTTIHRLETSRLRNVATFFGHLLATDALPWTLFAYIHLNEDETTSSSRIFVKILLQELSASLGVANLKTRFRDPLMAPYYQYMFPRDQPRNTRFAINYFTAVGLGELTEDLREFLKNMPRTYTKQEPSSAATPPIPTIQNGRNEERSIGSKNSVSPRDRSRTRSPSPADQHRRGRGTSSASLSGGGGDGDSKNSPDRVKDHRPRTSGQQKEDRNRRPKSSRPTRSPRRRPLRSRSPIRGRRRRSPSSSSTSRSSSASSRSSSCSYRSRSRTYSSSRSPSSSRSSSRSSSYSSVSSRSSDSH